MHAPSCPETDRLAWPWLCYQGNLPKTAGPVVKHKKNYGGENMKKQEDKKEALTR
jgi:hypothetical protein